MPTPEHHARLIDQPQDLESACADIATRQVLPLDTEFARTDTYRPRLCLIQVGAAPSMYCIDMLAGLDAAPLWSVLADPQRLKVMHAAKQDLEVFSQKFGALPGPLLDTQIAAALLGHPPQAGYAALVEAEFGVRLDKSQTRTDWTRRPLTPAQIEYAGDDVAWLLPLVERLQEKLRAAGREQWALEDSAALLDPALYRVVPERAWERMPAIERMNPAAQACAQRLAAWREQRADRSDRPRQWILSDQALLALATAAPADLAGIATLGVLTPGAIRNSGEALLAELRAAQAAFADGSLCPVQKPRPAAADSDQIRKLAERVQKIATGLGIAPEILATRAELGAVHRGSRTVRPLQGWRRSVVGDLLLATL